MDVLEFSVVAVDHQGAFHAIGHPLDVGNDVAALLVDRLEGAMPLFSHHDLHSWRVLLSVVRPVRRGPDASMRSAVWSRGRSGGRRAGGTARGCAEHPSRGTPTAAG